MRNDNELKKGKRVNENPQRLKREGYISHKRGEL